jgi:protein-S-isoprenylcysteine O-methyltransferase Ste14
MGPPVYRAPWPLALYYATWGLWVMSELRIMVRNRGGRGENLDRGSRVWVVGLVAVGLVAAVALARFEVGLVQGWGPVIAGVALALAGIVLRQWSVTSLGSFFTTAVEVQRDHRIVQTGPYAWLRHPSYTGALLTVVGLSLGLGSWLGCVVAALFGVAGLVQRILIEEHALSMRLGPAWTEFAARRKRLIPLVW